jgi:type IV secretory pathway VirJ component
VGGSTLLLLWQMGDGEDGAAETDTVINYYAQRWQASKAIERT